jgi:hypothetical protein
VVVTEASFLALQGIDELLETYELVRAHYNGELELAGVIVNRVVLRERLPGRRLDACIVLVREHAPVSRVRACSAAL